MIYLFSSVNAWVSELNPTAGGRTPRLVMPASPNGWLQSSVVLSKSVTLRRWSGGLARSLRSASTKARVSGDILILPVGYTFGETGALFDCASPLTVNLIQHLELVLLGPLGTGRLSLCRTLLACYLHLLSHKNGKGLVPAGLVATSKMFDHLNAC